MSTCSARRRRPWRHSARLAPAWTRPAQSAAGPRSGGRPGRGQLEKSWVSQTVPELSRETAMPTWVYVLLRMFCR